MRSFFGSILLILVLVVLGGTIYYHWSTNSHLEFEARHPDEPEKTTQVINMEQRAAALQQAMHAEQAPAEAPPAPLPPPEPAPAEPEEAPAPSPSPAEDIPYAEPIE